MHKFDIIIFSSKHMDRKLKSLGNWFDIDFLVTHNQFEFSTAISVFAPYFVFSSHFEQF